MKSVLIPTRPQWCEKICHEIGKDETGKSIYEKRIEVRKSAPKEVPFKAYIYCTKEKPFIQKIRFGDIAISPTQISNNLYNGKVIGEFICDKIEDFYCASVPYQKENNLGYGRFVDNGVYKVDGWHEGIVFERNDRFIDSMLNNNVLKEMCLSAQELFDYIGIGKHLYGWHISDLKIYDKPRELSEFRKALDRVWCSYFNDFCESGCIGFDNTDYVCNDYWKWEKGLTRPPQSWQYVEDLGEVK